MNDTSRYTYENETAFYPEHIDVRTYVNDLRDGGDMVNPNRIWLYVYTEEPNETYHD